MCERRTRKIKKGSQMNRLRETRRLQRLQRLIAVSPTPAPEEQAVVVPCPAPVVDKTAQCRLILELALKTIALMQKNSLIQQKIIALQKETSDFVASVMSNPDNQRRYAEQVRLYGAPAPVQTQAQTQPMEVALKLEPNA